MCQCSDSSGDSGARMWVILPLWMLTLYVALSMTDKSATSLKGQSFRLLQRVEGLFIQEWTSVFDHCSCTCFDIGLWLIACGSIPTISALGLKIYSRIRLQSCILSSKALSISFTILYPYVHTCSMASMYFNGSLPAQVFVSLIVPMWHAIMGCWGAPSTLLTALVQSTSANSHKICDWRWQ